MRTININYNNEILNSCGLDQDGLIKIFQDLDKILKEYFDILVPTTIDGTVKLDLLLELHRIFTNLSNVQGIQRHLKTYDQNNISPNLFVARVAYSLYGKTKDIIIEPEIKSLNGRNPDLKIDFESLTIYAECKSILTDQFNNKSRHLEIHNILEPYCNYPHQVSLHYKYDLSDEEVHAIGKSINKMLEKVTTSGKIIDNERIEVDVQLKNNYGSLDIDAEMQGLIEDKNDGSRLPIHSFYKKGKTIAVGGPIVDFSKVIKEKIDDSRTQSIEGFPFITILNSDLFLGNKNENIRAVNRLFQPDRNRRISGVLFANSESLQAGKFECFVCNPFSKYPLSRELEHKLFN